MTVYTWMVVLLLAAALLFKGNQKHNRVFIIIAFILLFAVMGLRDVYVTGNDSSGTFGSYPNIYRRVGDAEWAELFSFDDSNYNIGFTYFGKLVYEITNGDYQLFISIISFFAMFSYMRFIAKYSPSPIQSVLCMLGLMIFNLLFDVIKQTMAMSVLLFAFDAMIERKPIRFIILTVIAGAFHFPALVFIPAYWIGRMRLGRKYIVLLGALLAVTYIFRNQLLGMMMDAYGKGDSAATMESVTFFRNKVIIMIVIAAFAIYIRTPIPSDTVYNALMMFLGVAIIFQTFCGYNNIFERLADYYFHTAIILIPMIFERGGISRSRLDTAGNRHIINAVTVLVYAFFIWRFLSTTNASTYFMYHQFFWQR